MFKSRLETFQKSYDEGFCRQVREKFVVDLRKEKRLNFHTSHRRNEEKKLNPNIPACLLDKFPDFCLWTVDEKIEAVTQMLSLHSNLVENLEYLDCLLEEGYCGSGVNILLPMLFEFLDIIGPTQMRAFTCIFTISYSSKHSWFKISIDDIKKISKFTDKVDYKIDVLFAMYNLLPHIKITEDLLLALVDPLLLIKVDTEETLALADIFKVFCKSTIDSFNYSGILQWLWKLLESNISLEVVTACCYSIQKLLHSKENFYSKDYFSYLIQEKFHDHLMTLLSIYDLLVTSLVLKLILLLIETKPVLKITYTDPKNLELILEHAKYDNYEILTLLFRILKKLHYPNAAELLDSLQILQIINDIVGTNKSLQQLSSCFLWDIAMLYPQITCRFVQGRVFEILVEELGGIIDEDSMKCILNFCIIAIEFNQENANKFEDVGVYDSLVRSTTGKNNDIGELLTIIIEFYDWGTDDTQLDIMPVKRFVFS